MPYIIRQRSVMYESALFDVSEMGVFCNSQSPE
jgi:hypothetical protein